MLYVVHGVNKVSINKITEIKLSPEFYACHHWHVLEVGTDKLIGMFASLYCAAKTALDSPSYLMYRNKGKDRYVVDTVSGLEFNKSMLSGINTIVPVRFDDFIPGKAQKRGIKLVEPVDITMDCRDNGSW